VTVIAAFLLGLVVGSFLNVCIDRLPRGGSLIEPGSHCEACGRRLTPFELVPVLSYLFLKGRCRTCGARISLRVPLVELLTGAAYALVVLRFGWTAGAALAAVYTSFLIVIAFIDLEHHRILNVLTYPAIAIALVAAIAVPWMPTLTMLLGGALGGGALLALALVSPRAMGFGDVKLGAFLGLVLGYPLVLVGLFLAFVLGGAISAVLLVARRVQRGQAVAFGPYLSLGGAVALLYGDSLLVWWLARSGWS
jgi:leader peptidase (prepilin peptidase) / N-methyltransferase